MVERDKVGGMVSAHQKMFDGSGMDFILGTRGRCRAARWWPTPFTQQAGAHLLCPDQRHAKAAQTTRGPGGHDRRR